MKCLYFDTETTGLDPWKHDIVQISGIVEINGEVKEEFDILMKPFDLEATDPEALKIQGRTMEDLRGYQPPGDAYKQLIKIFEKYIDRYNKLDKFIPVGQNVRFDMDFMRSFFLKCGDKFMGSWLDNYRPVDLMALVSFLQYAKVFSLENQKLETVAKFFGYTYNAHSAIDDIRMTRTLMKDLQERFITKKKKS